ADPQLPDPRTLAVSLEPLEPGTYTVAWEVTSVTDGHRTNGSFRFIVTGGGRLFLGTGDDVTQTTIDPRLTLVKSLIRWVELAGLSLIAGTVGTLLVVWRPLLISAPGSSPSSPVPQLQRLVWAGLVIVGGALIADWLFRSVASAGANGNGLAILLQSVFNGPAALLMALRLALLVAIGVLWHRTGTTTAVPGTKSMGLVAGLTGLLLLGRSLGSHAAAAQSGLVWANVAADFLHLLAAAWWIGGLVALLVGLKACHFQRQVILRVLPRFSLLALAAIALIGVTGIYNGWLNVGSYRALGSTPYGQLLLLKSVVLLPVLALGAWHLFLGYPGLLGRLQQRFNELLQSAGPRLRFSLRGEMACLAVILALTSLLSSLPLAKDTLARSTRASEAPAAMPVFVEPLGLNVSFGVTPNRVGDNTLLLELTDSPGDPIATPAQVTARLSRLDGEVATEPLRLLSQSPGQYAAASNALSIVGAWNARVTVSVPGRQPVAIDYLFRVAGAPEEPTSIISGIAGFLSGGEPELPRTGPLVPPDSRADLGRRLLQQADASMNQLASLHECNNINGVVTVLNYSAPDGMQYTVRGGGASIISGDRRWYRRGEAPWQAQPRSSAFQFPDFRYSQGAQGVRWEASLTINDRLNHLVSFYSPRDDADYVFWIDAENHRINRLIMNVPPSHYMVSVFTEFDQGLPLITPGGPEGASLSSAPIAVRVVCDDYLP
ncbi:MAG: CopD family protein, partial [Dehalococcoidia bacterium]